MPHLSLQLTIASGDALDVREFSVVDRMSSLFEVTLLAVAENPDIDFEGVIGEAASLTLISGSELASTTRTFSGLCTEAQQVAVEEGGLSTYHLVLHPWMWLLTQRRNHRMFQQLSELDIALEVLSDWGIAPTPRITSAYKKRKYRVQYGESDFAFVSRMLEDAGISFYFETSGPSSQLVLSDAPQSNKARASIPFTDAPNRADHDYVTAVRMGRRVRPGVYTMRDHDYRKDPRLKLVAAGKAAEATKLEQKLERYHYTPGAFLFGTDKGDATPHADDRGKARTDEREAAALAQKRIDAKRGSARTVTFETNALDLAPGVVLSLLDHPRRDLAPDKRLLVVESALHGRVGYDFSIHIEARSAEIPYRPALVTPKPKVLGVESATVVGPAGEEIHTDEFGRVRVHFHWDRQSGMNEKSSCWIHVSQPWGGAGYGGTNLPRIGQEVIVDFLGGDPDRPIITGRVYTGLQKVPYALPLNKTQSGWKSSSTGGTGGYNELMFEDAAGKELLRMQAERDMNTLVKRDQELIVGHDRTTFVKHDDSLTVSHDLSKHVLKNEREVTGLNLTSAIGVNRTTHVGAIDTTVVGAKIVTWVSPPGGAAGPGTSHTTQHDTIELATPGGAKITLKGPNITLTGANISLDAKQKMTITGKDGTDLGASGGPVRIQGGPMVLINPAGGLFSGRVTDLAPDAIRRGAATVLVGGPQFPFDVERLPNGDLKVGKAITIKGDATFQGNVMANLGKMSTTTSGMHVLDVIDKSGRTMDIIKFTGNNSFCGANNTWADLAAQTPAGKPVYDGSGNPIMGPDGKPLMGTGTGANTTLQLNPDLTLPNGQDPAHPMPNDAIMFHEMTHGTHQMTGTADMSPVPGWDTHEEQTTILSGTPSEADYLKETGYGYHRTDHDLTWAPN